MIIKTLSYKLIKVQDLNQVHNLKKIILYFLVVFSTNLFSQVTLSGGKGLLRVYEAEVITPGQFYANSIFSFFAEKNEEMNSLNEDYTLNLAFTFGLARYLELFTHIVPTQADQTHIWGPPGDSKLGLKFSFPGKGRVTQFGVVSYADFPTCQIHPVPYETYSEDGIGWALLGLLSINLKNSYSRIPVKFSINLGYKDHNYKNPVFSGVTDQFLGGVGIKYPIKSSLFYSEISGEFFPYNDKVEFRQNFYRFTQGFKFIGPGRLIFDIALDIELGRYNPSSQEIKTVPRFYENYADWKLILGVTYRTILFKGLNEDYRRNKQIEESENLKLDKIRNKRERVIKELEQYQRDLEKDNKEKNPIE